MKVGVPKEIKTHEYRVGLTPAAVREYVAAGHEVMVEANAGGGIGATDDIYRKAGATILHSDRELFASSEMIVKVKEPQPSEWIHLRENQILFTYLHLAPDPEQARGPMQSGCTAISYETVTDAHGGLPLLAPMSEVAGRLAIEAAAAALKRYAGGRGLLIGGVPGVQPARTVVIGGGVVGTHAARMTVGLGAEVSILDRSIPGFARSTNYSKDAFVPDSRRWMPLRTKCWPRMSSLALSSSPVQARRGLSDAAC